ncbi:MAG: hypothetical protein ACK5LY_05600 [Lachnospirales bacterium]
MKKYIFSAIIVGIIITNYSIKESKAVTATPGTAADPVVTKSYVDEQIAIAIANAGSTTSNNTSTGITTTTPQLTQAQIDEITASIYADVLEQTSDITPLHVPVQAFKGQTILGAQGTEIILRSGECIIYSVAENGVTNLTNGLNLNAGDSVALDNLLIVPRQDGRGVTVTTDECWFMIRGEYEIIG